MIGTNSINPAEALSRLQKICSAQEKCPADVILLLKRWGVPQQHHAEIMSRLKEERFIDESRFAAAFVRDKVYLDHWGFFKISYFLRQKGIPVKLIDEACSRIDRNEYAEMIRKELEKKRKTVKGTSREIWAKLARYGSSRGYETDVMHEFLDDMARDD